VWLNGIAFYGKPITEVRSVTCRMGSHNVTYHATQVNASRHNLRRTSARRYSIYLPHRYERLSWVYSCFSWRTPVRTLPY